jgi:AcrR family transcriptional regulator
MAPRHARALAGDPDRALRDHLVEVTERLLAESGPAHLTTRRIARTAGVADGVLYNHFENKDELMLAALAARVTRLFGDFRDRCPEAGTATVEANLEQLATALLELQRALLPLLVGLLGKHALMERFLAAIHASDIGGPDAVLSCVHEYLEAERGLGRLSDEGELHLVGVLLFAITQLQALVTHFRASDATTAQAARELQPFTHFLAETLMKGANT